VLQNAFVTIVSNRRLLQQLQQVRMAPPAFGRRIALHAAASSRALTRTARTNKHQSRSCIRNMPLCCPRLRQQRHSFGRKQTPPPNG
jgi:hypothetical protein